MNADARRPGDVREAMLEIIKGLDHPHGSIDTTGVVQETVNRIIAKTGPFTTEGVTLEALDCWHDLMRSGFLAWGAALGTSMSMLNPPYAHVTAAGKRSLANVSRDPANPRGYMAGLKGILPENSVAEAYVLEALATFNVDCFKATAVLVGAAAESLVMDLRDTLVEKLGATGQKPPKELSDRSVKHVLEALEKAFDARKRAMPQGLSERFESFWSAFTGHLRITRNEAGHPTSIAPVTKDDVHGALLMFPQLAKLVADLQAWSSSSTFG